MTQGTKEPMLAMAADQDPVPPAVLGIVLMVGSCLLGLLLVGGLPGSLQILEVQHGGGWVLASAVLALANVVGMLVLAWAALIALAKLHAIYLMLRDQEHRHAAERAGVTPRERA